MGGKNSKSGQNRNKLRNVSEMRKNEFLKYLVVKLSPLKTLKLDDAILAILNKQTGLTYDKINELYNAFLRHCTDGKLDKSQFIKLYNEIKPETIDNSTKMSKYIFKAFDLNHDGSLNFNEFLIGYSLTNLNKEADLPANELEFLSSQTHCSKEEIRKILAKFNENNPDGLLDKQEFLTLYSSLRPEWSQNLEELSSYIFRTFDGNDDGFITFSEFLIAYSLTSSGDAKSRLEYAFDLYDLDKNGCVTLDEIKTVIPGVLKLLRAEKKYNIDELGDKCIAQLDTSKDGIISKDEFIEGLLKNEELRHLMSPFN